MTDGTGEKAKKAGGKGCLMTILAIFGLIVILAVAGSNEAQREAETLATTPPIEVSATELAKAYDANEAAAQQRFGARPIRVTGVVQGVDLDFMDNPVVRIEGVNQFLAVSAHFDKETGAGTAALSKGQQITVTCAKVSEVIGAPQLRDCRL